MKFFVHSLFAIAALVFGFFMGVRYQARVESLNEVNTLVQVQKNKIDGLRDENQRLQTVVLLREFLDGERIRLPQTTVNDIATSIHEASRRYKLPPEMILAVIRIESAFDINAQSDKGAAGLIQILPSTAQEIAQELRMDWRGEANPPGPPAENEDGGQHLYQPTRPG